MAIATLDRAFDRLAQVRGSMDAAVAHQLGLLASFVCDSWDGPAASDLRQSWGDFTVVEPAANLETVPSIDTEPERNLYRLRQRLLEGRGIADGIVHQELASILLERRVFRPLWFVISYLKSLEPKLDVDGEDTFDALAESYLKRLAEHSFGSWPENVRAALAPVVSFAAAQSPSRVTSAALVVQPQRAVATSHQGLLAMRLTEALPYWEKQRRPRASAVTEATRAVTRFVALFGDPAIGDLTRERVIEFRNLVADIPPQTEVAKVEARGQTLREVIEIARAARVAWAETDRSMPEPDRLAPGSVKKDVGALSSILGAVADDIGVENVNVALKIPIPGYSKRRKGQKKPRLPFTPEMMQKLFDSPLFTGCAGYGDIARTRPGPHLYQDEMYWCLLFGVVGGPRLGEIGQIALSDVHQCDLGRTYGDDYQGEITFVHITGTGEDQHVKNDESDRYVVIHDRLIDLGFKEYVAQRRAQGMTRLFDLDLGSAGGFTKSLSQRLNRYLDRVVIDDDRYVFHSTRHEFTDRANLSDMPTRVANAIKGHANMNVADEYGLVSILNQYIHAKKLRLGFINWARLMAAKEAGARISSKRISTVVRK